VSVSVTIHPEAARVLGADNGSLQEFVSSCLDEHRRLIDTNDKAVRKNSPESAVTLVTISGFPRVCVKEFRWRGWLHSMKGLFRRTQGLRTYRNGWRLLSAGFPVASPLVLVRDRRMGLIRSEWIIMEVPTRSMEMDRYLVKKTAENWPVEEKRSVAARFGRYLGSLHADGIFHADLKTCNILVIGIRQPLHPDPPTPLEPDGSWTETHESMVSVYRDRDNNLESRWGSLQSIRFCLLDYDEVRFSGQVPAKRRLKNLVQIFLSTPLAIGATDRLRFLSEYALHLGVPHREKRKIARAVVAASRGRDILYVGPYGDVRENWEHPRDARGGGLTDKS
jgi:tRNA A-37 threonylcarbamoyl transferase component Bud32